MLRKPVAVQSLGIDRGISDPLDSEIIRKLFKKDVREGEEKLMLAALRDAIDKSQKHVLAKDGERRKLFREAEEWFLEKDGDCLFSFEYICDTLELHPDYIRQGLSSWKKARRKERSLHGLGGSRKKLAKSRVVY